MRKVEHLITEVSSRGIDCGSISTLSYAGKRCRIAIDARDNCLRGQTAACSGCVSANCCQKVRKTNDGVYRFEPSLKRRINCGIGFFIVPIGWNVRPMQFRVGLKRITKSRKPITSIARLLIGIRESAHKEYSTVPFHPLYKIGAQNLGGLI